MNRGTLDVEFPGGGVVTYHTVEVARLELVGISGQRLQVADPVVAGPRAENRLAVLRGKGAQHGVAARAAAADGHAVGVNVASLRQIARAVDAILHVHDSPLSLQALAVGAAVAGAAAVVDV